MLAEKRQKNKWSQDPQNSRWSRDKSKFGYRMLERMGWEEGKGLGSNEDGKTQLIKISKKEDNRGVGRKRGRDEGWLEHQDAFDKILAGLNAAQSEKAAGQVDRDALPGGGRTLVDNATESKKIVYNRFLRSKDLSAQSSEDLDCVLGRKRRKQQTNEEEGEKCGVDREEEELEKDVPLISHGITTVTKTQTVQDYFSLKMKAKKASRTKDKEVISSGGAREKRKHKSKC